MIISKPDCIHISWEEFEKKYPAFERPEAELVLWHKEVPEEKFIFLFVNNFLPITAEIYYGEIYFKAKADDEESKENALNEFRAKYLEHSMPFLNYGGL